MAWTWLLFRGMEVRVSVSRFPYRMPTPGLRFSGPPVLSLWQSRIYHERYQKGQPAPLPLDVPQCWNVVLVKKQNLNFQKYVWKKNLLTWKKIKEGQMCWLTFLFVRVEGQILPPLTFFFSISIAWEHACVCLSGQINRVNRFTLVWVPGKWATCRYVFLSVFPAVVSN